MAHHALAERHVRALNHQLYKPAHIPLYRLCLLKPILRHKRTYLHEVARDVVVCHADATGILACGKRVQDLFVITSVKIAGLPNLRFSFPSS